ncbi:TPA: sulfate adenylyltransferase subunit CysD [Escherichia coli]
MDQKRLTHLRQLEAESIHIIREVAAEFSNPVMLYSIGKDSSVMLHLARKAFYPGTLPFPLLHVDTGWKFREMYEFRDRTAKAYGCELLVHKNPEGVAMGINPFVHGSAKHTDIMKTEGLKQALNKYGFDAAFGGARRDEEKSRAKERIYSFRDRFHRWDPKNQRPELWHNYNGQINKGESIRVFPLSNWTEQDIWQYIWLENIDIVPLSALEGDNVASQSESMPWYSGPTLLEVLETVEIQRVVDAQPMRFPVQYVNRPNLDFRGYAGTLASGRVEVGQRVKVLPSGVESNVARIVTFDGDREEAFAGEAITLVLTDEIDISRGDLLLAADEALPAVQSASVDVVWMAEQPLSPGQSYDIKIAGKKTRARVDGIRYQVDINNLTQREVENLPLNGIGLVDLTFDEPLVLDRYQQNPVTGGLIFIDRLSNVTVGAGMVHEPVSQATAAPSEFSAFELELNALVRRHFPHWGARDLLGDK